MPQPAQSHPIPIAHAGPITDRQLEQIIQSGDMLQNDLQPSESDLYLLLLTAPQIAQELLRRRRAMSVAQDVMDIDNVILMPGT